MINNTNHCNTSIEAVITIVIIVTVTVVLDPQATVQALASWMAIGQSGSNIKVC